MKHPVDWRKIKNITNGIESNFPQTENLREFYYFYFQSISIDQVP